MVTITEWTVNVGMCLLSLRWNRSYRLALVIRPLLTLEAFAIVHPKLNLREFTRVSGSGKLYVWFSPLHRCVSDVVR